MALYCSTDWRVHWKIKQNMLALSLYVTLYFSYMSYTYDNTELRAATCIIPRKTLHKPGALLRFAGKMLAVFEKAIGNPPEELSLPSTGLTNSKNRQEIAEIFQSLWPESTLFNLSNGNFMALSHEDESPLLPRSIVVMDDIFCIFIGTLENMCELKRHYGLSRQATEAMVLIEAYKVLRDRAPYPPDQVVKDLEGKFAFVLFDAKSHTLFTTRDRDGSVDFKWGMAGDGSLICSNDTDIIREACGKSWAPFPPG
ncbi:hypothetical protein Patl1_10771 [Pistacia atlantica]|uniref:Uncharacterized protein n=1 Tax=Pistacia atlantica TaxID=434234 RepID=A0ACC1A2D1_9ROSI|nr:hypothetical protein Patl1_10771 [Pistacia atlantica]